MAPRGVAREGRTTKRRRAASEAQAGGGTFSRVRPGYATASSRDEARSTSAFFWRGALRPPATYGFVAMKEDRSGKTAAIVPGTDRDRGGGPAESDGIAAKMERPDASRTRASRLRRLFRAAILGRPRLRTGFTTKHTIDTKGSWFTHSFAGPSSSAEPTEDESTVVPTTSSAAGSRGYTVPSLFVYLGVPSWLLLAWRFEQEAAAHSAPRLGLEV